MTFEDREKKAPPASYADFGDPPKAGPLRTVVQFFAIPLLIVCAAVGLFLGLSLLFDAGPKSTRDFITLLRSDTINRRWQAAMEISRQLGGEEVPAEFRDPELVRALVQTLEKAQAAREERLATHVLAIFERLRDPRTHEAVLKAAGDEHPWIRSNALLVLGGMQDPASRPILEAALGDQDAGTRQAALHGLARLDRPRGEFRLSQPTRDAARRLLGDADPYVRFQAALLLGRAGETEGVTPILAKMLDRSYLDTLPFDTGLTGIDRRAVNTTDILQTLEVVAELGPVEAPELREAVRRLTDDDAEGDVEVRQRARVALRNLTEPARE